MISYCSKCDNAVSSNRPITVPCHVCGTPVDCMGGGDLLQISPTEWPSWAKAIAEHRNDSDVGVGDTFKRMLGTTGEILKGIANWLNVPCGCGARQSRWNKRFPYDQTKKTL